MQTGEQKLWIASYPKGTSNASRRGVFAMTIKWKISRYTRNDFLVAGFFATLRMTGRSQWQERAGIFTDDYLSREHREFLHRVHRVLGIAYWYGSTRFYLLLVLGFSDPHSRNVTQWWIFLLSDIVFRVVVSRDIRVLRAQ